MNDPLSVRSESRVDELLRQFLSEAGPHLDGGSGRVKTTPERAFSELYRLLNPRLSAYCYKMVPDAWQDIVQEVWERTIRLRDRVGTEKNSEIRSAEAFLFRIARNLCMDHYRAKQETTPLHDKELAVETTAEHSLEWLVRESLERLSFEDREVLVLNIYSGYKLGEIAAMQDKSEDAIWARASRARARLRTLCEEDARKFNVSLPASKRTK